MWIKIANEENNIVKLKSIQMINRCIKDETYKNCGMWHHVIITNLDQERVIFQSFVNLFRQSIELLMNTSNGLEINYRAFDNHKYDLSDDLNCEFTAFDIELGVYKTKEHAEKIFNEIINNIKNGVNYYEMPKDEFWENEEIEEYNKYIKGVNFTPTSAVR